MSPEIVPNVGSSTPQFGANISVKSFSGGLQLTVLFSLQLALHSFMYCKAMQPRPGLLFSCGSFFAVRFLLITSTRSFA
ncbi:hypothetical protein Hanom_Chr04g00353171 [Helianthus anomalus]